MSYFLLLLVPVLLLLVVRVRRRQRLLFSLAWLLPARRRPLPRLLGRTLQLYHDVLADLLIALVLALVLAGLLDFAPRRAAVCLDASHSMARGEGATAQERAVQLLASGTLGLGRYRLFAAGFDPAAGAPRLYDLGSHRAGVSAEKLRGSLQGLGPAFSADPGQAAALLDRGYRRVVYLTDRLVGPPGGLEVVEVGEDPASYFYPLSADFEEREGSFRLRVLRHDYGGPIRVSRFDEGRGAFTLVSAGRPQQAPEAVAELRVQSEGLYRLSGDGVPDFLLPLQPPVLPVRAEGAWSSLLVESLPWARPSPEGMVLADVPWDGSEPTAQGAALRRALRTTEGILTVIPEADGALDTGGRPQGRAYLHNLRDTLSLPVCAELPPELLGLGPARGRLLFLDPYRQRDPGVALAYLGALWHARAPRPMRRPGQLPAGARLSGQRSGSACFAYRSAEGTAVINLPPEEFFPLPSWQAAAQPARQALPPGAPGRTKPLGARLPAAALLLGLYAAKLAALRWLRGREPARLRESGAGNRPRGDPASPR